MKNKQKQLKSKEKNKWILLQIKTRVGALTNKYDHKSIYKEIFDKTVKEKFDGIKEMMKWTIMI